jgi:quinol monooxygenase YgiN
MPEDDRSASGYADFATGDFYPGNLAEGAPDAGWQQPADGTGHVAGYNELGPRDPAGQDPRDRAGYDGDVQPRHGRGSADRPDRTGAQADDQSRRELFGQITIYTLAEDRLAEFDKLTDRVVEQVRLHEPDTLVFIAHAVPSAPSQRILYEVFRSKAAYQRHLAQSYIQQFELDRRPYVLAKNVVELGLQQAKVSPFPSVAELFPEPGFDTSGFERPDYLRDYGRDSAALESEPREYR